MPNIKPYNTILRNEVQLAMQRVSPCCRIRPQTTI
jgi:hypothetical protein